MVGTGRDCNLRLYIIQYPEALDCRFLVSSTSRNLKRGKGKSRYGASQRLEISFRCPLSKVRSRHPYQNSLTYNWLDWSQGRPPATPANSEIDIGITCVPAWTKPNSFNILWKEYISGDMHDELPRCTILSLKVKKRTELEIQNMVF